MEIRTFKRFKFFILDLISFGSSSAIVLDLTFILLLLIFLPTSHLGYLPTKSIYSNLVIPYFFKNSCPSEGLFRNCGFYSIGQTRALSRLLHGDFSGAWQYNRLVFVLFFVICAVLLINLIKVYKNYRKTRRIFNY